MTFERTCPVCNRNFASSVANATYCNPSCRRAAGREAEKAKALIFRPPEEKIDERILWVEEMPTLARVREMATALEVFVRMAKVDRGIVVHGTFPDGWQNTEFVSVTPARGAAKPTWNMTCFAEDVGPQAALPHVQAALAVELRPRPREITQETLMEQFRKASGNG